MSRHAARESGNTLVELLIVVVVLAILAAIAIPVYLSQRGRSVEAGMRADLRSTATLMETYYVDHRGYPDDLADLREDDDDFRFSGRTEVTIELVDAAGYCLRAENPGATTTLRYDSTAGGLLDPDESCA